MPSSAPPSDARTAQVSSEPLAQDSGTNSPRNASASAREYGHGVVRYCSKSGSWQYSVTRSASAGVGSSRTSRAVRRATGRTLRPVG